MAMKTGSLTDEEYQRVRRAVAALDDLRSGTPDGYERFKRWRVETFGPHRYGPGHASPPPGEHPNGRGEPR